MTLASSMGTISSTSISSTQQPREISKTNATPPADVITYSLEQKLTTIKETLSITTSYQINNNSLSNVNESLATIIPWTTIVIAILVGIVIILTALVMYKSKKSLKKWWCKQNVLKKKRSSTSKDGNPTHKFENSNAVYQTEESNIKIMVENLLYSNCRREQTEDVKSKQTICNELRKEQENKNTNNEVQENVYNQIADI